MNPPYAAKLIGLFIDKLITEKGIQQAITLTNNATETQWGQKLLNNANIVCFLNKRIRFLAPEGEKKTGLQGQMICGFDVDPVRFQQEFAPLGIVLENFKPRAHS